MTHCVKGRADLGVEPSFFSSFLVFSLTARPAVTPARHDGIQFTYPGEVEG